MRLVSKVHNSTVVGIVEVLSERSLSFLKIYFYKDQNVDIINFLR